MVKTELPVLSFQDDDGVMKEYYITGRFSYENRDYIALIPQDRNGGTVELFRCSDGGGDKIKIENITSDIELEEASKIYHNLLQSENNFISEQEPDESKVISIPDADGVYHDCEIISTFNYNDIDYIALMPIKANKDGSASIMLYSYYTTSLDMNQIIYFSMRYRLFYMMRYEVIF